MRIKKKSVTKILSNWSHKTLTRISIGKGQIISVYRRIEEYDREFNIEVSLEAKGKDKKGHRKELETIIFYKSFKDKEKAVAFAKGKVTIKKGKNKGHLFSYFIYLSGKKVGWIKSAIIRDDYDDNYYGEIQTTKEWVLGKSDDYILFEFVAHKDGREENRNKVINWLKTMKKVKVLK